MDIVARITAIGAVVIAMYGAALAAFREIQEHRDRKPRLRVSLALVAQQHIPGSPGSPAKAYYFSAPLSDQQTRFLALNAENIGERVVTLSALGLLPPKDDLLLLPPSPSSSPFPRRLEPGESCIDVWPADEVARSLRAIGFTGTIPLGGFYIDGLRKHYRAKSLTFEVDVWSSIG